MVRQPGAHAEVTAVNGARATGLTPEEIATTCNICGECRTFLEEDGATVTGAENGEVAMTGKYDEADLLRRLEPLGRSSKTAFAAACAERLLPLVERHAELANITPVQVARLRAALDAVWRSCTGESTDIGNVQLLAESLVPQEDDNWKFETGYVQNGIAVVAYAARTWLTDDAQEALWAARQVLEAADYGAQRNIPEIVTYSADVESDLHDSPVVRGAVSALEKDFEAAAQGDPLRAQQQSRVDATVLADIFP